MTNHEQQPPLHDDGLLGVVEKFDDEVAQTRRNSKLMALLDERGKQNATISLDDVKRQLGLVEE
jgi:tRNA uridine 5-carbamoylmethylation protein Kti12